MKVYEEAIWDIVKEMPEGIEEPHPCPRCNANEQRIWHYHDNKGRQRYTIMCDRCKQSGPFAETLEKATDAWNRMNG